MKKFTKLLCGVLGLGFLLAGCGSSGDVKNSSSEIVYNGNSAVMVDGHLFYGNAFSDITTFTDDNSYKTAAKLSYLARLNTNVDLAAENKDFSPQNVTNLSELVSGYSKSNMFALGNYVYYATPNREEISGADGVSHKYNYTTLYRTNINGGSAQKLYTTEGEIRQMEVLKQDGKYFVVIFAGSKLVKFEIGENVGGVQIIAENVNSVAMPKTYQQDKLGSTLDFNGYIYYTTARTVEEYPGATGTTFNRVLLTNAEGEAMSSTTKSISLVGREKDVVFFTSDSETYSLDLSDNTSKNVFTAGTQSLFYSGSISNVSLVATANKNYGYLFNSNSKLIYKPTDGAARVVKFNDNTQTAISSYNILATDGTAMYISTTTAIYKADFALIDASGNISCQTVVKMTAIYNGSLYAYDGKYIYFFAQLENTEEETEEETKITDTDANYYLYRVKADVNPNAETQEPYQLLSKTETSERHS